MAHCALRVGIQGEELVLCVQIAVVGCGCSVDHQDAVTRDRRNGLVRDTRQGKTTE